MTLYVLSINVPPQKGLILLDWDGDSNCPVSVVLGYGRAAFMADKMLRHDIYSRWRVCYITV